MNNNILKNKIIIMTLVASQMLACQPSEVESHPSMLAEKLIMSTQCASQNESMSIRLYEKPDDLRKSLQVITRNNEIVDSLMSKIDFKWLSVLQINMGLKRTGGYSLSLLDGQFEIDRGVGLIRLKLDEPDKNSMVTQALTSPCLFAVVPAGGFDTIKLFNQAGDVLMKQDVHHQ